MLLIYETSDISNFPTDIFFIRNFAFIFFGDRTMQEVYFQKKTKSAKLGKYSLLTNFMPFHAFFNSFYGCFL